jgi:hypothetical protein
MKSGFFTDEFLRSLPSDNLEALVVLANEFHRLISPSEDYVEKDLNTYLEAHAIFCAFVKARKIDAKLAQLEDLADWKPIEERIYMTISQRGAIWKQELTKRTRETILSETEARYSDVFSSEQTYEFSDKDIKRVQTLVDELRGLISSSALIGEGHKRRLLRRLEAMQRELHKHTSDIDRFWGFVAEAGIVSRKFGEDMKPISDRVFELGKIVLAVIMAKEGVQALPEISKLFLPK